jgi:pyruvate/2-oxoglutarate dehydrogenase complex dihydrolipoamide acyltransferase (E2) component
MTMARVGITLLVGICLVVLAAACEEGEEEAAATPTATATATATAMASPTESPTPTASGAARYEVTVRFNTSVTQDDIDEASALLRAYDDDLEFVIMESWPPIGRALLATNVADFCQTVEAELNAKSYVDDASCGPA